MRDRLRRAWAWYRRRRWHNQIAIALGILLVILGVIVGTVRLTTDDSSDFDTSGPRSEPDAAVRSALEEQFAPVVKLDSHELLVPIDIPSYVSVTSLDERHGKRLEVVDGSPTAATLPSSEDGCRAAAGCAYVLDVRGVEPPRSKPSDYATIQQQLLANGARLTVYAHVLHYDETGDFAVQYWFLYIFNYRLNEHESDWEQITVGLDKDRQPKKVLYSSHSTGFTRDWGDVEQENGHPVVYVAVGSHANYFHAGSHDVTVSCPKLFRSFRVCIAKRDIRDKSDGRGLVLEPLNYRLAEFKAPVFVGSFGTGNYLLGHRANEILADPRTRSAWRNPLARLEKGKAL